MNYLQQRKRMVSGIGMWWLADGMSEGNCLAAWQFKNRYTQADATKDMTGHGYALTNSGCAWSSSGFNTSCISHGSNGGCYLDNASLRSNGKTIIWKIVGASHSGYAAPLGTIGSVGIWTSTPFMTQSYWLEVSGQIGKTHQNGHSADIGADKVKIGGWQGDGVFGFTLSGEALYKNGNAISLSNASYPGHGNWTAFICSSVPRLVSGYVNVTANTRNTGAWNYLGSYGFHGAFTIQALAVYSINLTQAQHQAIYKKMLAI